jgi:hypothetical protein
MHAKANCAGKLLSSSDKTVAAKITTTREESALISTTSRAVDGDQTMLCQVM